MGNQAKAYSEIIRISQQNSTKGAWSLRIQQSLSYLMSFSKRHFDLIDLIKYRGTDDSLKTIAANTAEGEAQQSVSNDDSLY